jgi:hypothetical protein
MTGKKAFIISLLCLLTSMTHAAQAPLYRFELILFEYTNNQYSDTETWPTEAGEPDYSDVLTYITSNNYKAGSAINSRGYTFQLQKPGQLILKKEASAIKRSSSRKLLLHTGWIQSMHPEKKARPVAIKIGKTYTSLDTGRPGGTSIYSDYQNPVSTPVRHKQIEGSIKISISRFLHVWSDLLFRRPHYNTSTNSSEYVDTQAFRYRDHRKMRSKELHYIDNPSFGMLIYALPVKSSAKAN